MPSVDQCHQFIIVIEGNQVDCNDSYHLGWPGLAWHGMASTPTKTPYKYTFENILFKNTLVKNTLLSFRLAWTSMACHVE